MTTRKKIKYPDPSSEFIYDIFVRCPSYQKSAFLIQCKSRPHTNKKAVIYRFADKLIEERVKKNVQAEVEEALRDYRFPKTENLTCVNT